MREAIEYPSQYAGHYEFYGKKPLKGILLYGPPGCGKTMLGKAAATATAKLHGKQGVTTGFVYVKGPELLSQYVGLAEAAIRGLFVRTREHYRKHKYPAVMFIDEADALLAARGSGISSDVERTTVPQFLSEMDGFEDNGCLVILATNRANTLDPAVVRDGRIDRKVKVTRPSVVECEKIFYLYLQRVPLSNGQVVDQVCEQVTYELFHEKNTIYQIHLKANGHAGAKHNFTLGHLASGAMVNGIVDQASSIAMHREINNKSKPQGICADDLKVAVNRVYRQNLDLRHHDDLNEFVNRFGGRDQVENVVKMVEV